MLGSLFLPTLLSYYKGPYRGSMQYSDNSYKAITKASVKN